MHQVSDADKANVSAEAAAAAEKLRREAFDKRLNEIGMSDVDYNRYNSMRSAVLPQISQLRQALASFETRGG